MIRVSHVKGGQSGTRRVLCNRESNNAVDSS
jgi:hypothetical protein